MKNPAKPAGAQHFASKCTGEQVLENRFQKETITGRDLLQRSANDYSKHPDPGEKTTPDAIILMTRLNPYRPKG